MEAPHPSLSPPLPQPHQLPRLCFSMASPQWNQIRCLTAACRALVDLQTNGDLLSSPSVVYGAAQQSNSGPLLFFVSYFFHLGTQRNGGKTVGGKSSGKGCLFWCQIQRDSDKRNQRTGQKAPNTERQRRRKPTNRQGKKLRSKDGGRCDQRIKHVRCTTLFLFLISWSICSFLLNFSCLF